MYGVDMSITMKGLYNAQFANEQTLGTWSQIFSQEGVLRGLNVTAQTTPSLNVDISVGVALVNGEDTFNRFTYFQDIEGQSQGFATPPIVGQSRNDLLVIKVTQVNSLNTTVVIDVVQGSPATTGTQVDPDLIETTDLFYLVLARVTLVGGSSVITGGQITYTTSSKSTHNNINAVSTTIFPIRQLATLKASYLETLQTSNLIDDIITQAKMADNSVGTAEIIDGSVTVSELASNAVTTAKILDSNVTTAKIADNAITQAKLDTGISVFPKNDLFATRLYAPTVNYSSANGFSISGGSTANIISADGYYHQISVSGTSSRGYLSDGQILRLDLEPTLIFRLRSPSSFTLGAQLAHFIGLGTGQPANFTNGANPNISFRSNDNGAVKESWTPICYDGTTLTTGTPMVANTINTAYVFKIRIVNVSGTYTAYFSINGGVEQSININLPSPSAGLTVFNWVSNQLSSAGGIPMNTNSIYIQSK